MTHFSHGLQAHQLRHAVRAPSIDPPVGVSCCEQIISPFRGGESTPSQQQHSAGIRHKKIHTSVALAPQDAVVALEEALEPMLEALCAAALEHAQADGRETILESDLQAVSKRFMKPR